MSMSFFPVPARGDLFKEIFESFPAALLVLDQHIRILHLNQAAAALGGNERKAMIYRQNGDAFHCVHAAESPDGCGHAPACAHCAVRTSVQEVLAGHGVARRAHRALLGTYGHVRELDLRITAKAFQHQNERLALVVLEEITAPGARLLAPEQGQRLARAPQ